MELICEFSTAPFSNSAHHPPFLLLACASLQEFFCARSITSPLRGEYATLMGDVADFETYEDYLDSQVTETDLFYTEDVELARQLVELGYRGSGDTLKREDFETRKCVSRMPRPSCTRILTAVDAPQAGSRGGAAEQAARCTKGPRIRRYRRERLPSARGPRREGRDGAAGQADHHRLCARYQPQGAGGLGLYRLCAPAQAGGEHRRQLISAGPASRGRLSIPAVVRALLRAAKEAAAEALRPLVLQLGDAAVDLERDTKFPGEAKADGPSSERGACADPPAASCRR